MLHKINQEIFTELIKCKRSAFLSLSKASYRNNENLEKIKLLKAEMIQRVSMSHNDKNGKSIIGEVLISQNNKYEALCDFQFFTNEKHQLFCCFPVKYKLTKYEIHQAAFTYFVASLSGKTFNQVIGVRFKNDKDSPNIITDDNFVYTDITNSVINSKRQNLIKSNIKSLFENLRNNSIPKATIGSCCNAPYTCPMKEYCFQKEFGTSENIFDLKDSKFSLILRQYWKGITKIEELEPSLVLPERTKRQIESYKSKKENVIYHELNRSFSMIKNDKELLFLDIEFLTKVNISDNSLNATSNIPYAFSVIHYSEDTGATYQVQVCNVYQEVNSHYGLIDNLIQIINLYSNLKIVVFNKSNIIRKLKSIYSINSKEYFDINKFEKRIWDLRDVFLNREYYHPLFKGSNYLKDICKVIAPDVYSNSDLLKTGVQAENFYKTNAMRKNGLNTENITELENYVNRDVYAIIHLYYYLKNKYFR